jgi:AmmeMemoRadiSam system protein B/AmmeMemoRadiSam system protein A
MDGLGHAHGPTRQPAVAGTFYPAGAAELRGQLEGMLAEASHAGSGAGRTVASGRRPKAMVVPHAGTVYSGPIAASAYALLQGAAPETQRVVLLGPSHRVALEGLALPGCGAFETPLGAVPVDAEGAAAALAIPGVRENRAAHAREHSLEVQLPFLQLVLGSFSIVPLVVGEASPELVARVLEALWGGEETLFVISTDLSHYLPYREAQDLDGRTTLQLLALDEAGIEEGQACGRAGLQGLLRLSRRRRLRARQLDLRNSGDTAGDRGRVVGYGAFAFSAPDPEEPSQERAQLITALARASLRSLFGGPSPARPTGPPWLLEPRACFVSLHKRGELRGCIGVTTARAPLWEEVARCARSAASEDTRFPPVEPEELADLSIEVSVLSQPEPLPAASEEEALAALRPGVDGLLLEAAGRRAVFIPAVWGQLPSPREFLQQLQRKAGLPARWTPGTLLQRFTAEQYEEEEP